MRLYEDGDFVEREDARRAIRDTYRKKFFSSLPVQASTDPFSVEGDAGNSLANILSLAKRAGALHMGDTSAIAQSIETLSALGLSTGTNAGGSEGVSFQDMTIASLTSSHFLFDWRF